MIDAYEPLSPYNGLLVGDTPGATYGKYSIMKPVAMTVGHRIDCKKEEIDGNRTV